MIINGMHDIKHFAGISSGGFMRNITRDSNSYYIDGKPGFLISGEFQYFRIPKDDWDKRLDLLIQAGGNCVATYIPWVLHEPVEGVFKSGDQPYRDLEGFLNLCKSKNLPVIARPGPYQYSEMKYNGLPEWLVKEYPEILALDIDGNTMSIGSISYLHPVFLEKTKKWFDYICPIIARYTEKNGGPVTSVQIDNELAGIHEWNGGWDYSPIGMGIGSEDGRYAKFLKRKYSSISAVSKTYDTKYESFANIKPKRDCVPVMDKDYRDFYLSAIAEFCVLLAGWMRDHGIDCDLIHNAGNTSMNPYFLETVSALGDDFILGSDLYYNLNMDWEANNPSPKAVVRTLICHDELKLMGFPPTIYEMQAGSASEWPPILPEDLKCWYMANIAFGMKGVNYYVFTGGPNPERIGADGHIYDYGAGIAADGTVRPVYYAQKEFGTFLNDNSWLSRTEKVSDFYLGLDWEQARCKNDSWEFMQKGLMISSLCASMMPEFIDLGENPMFPLLRFTDKPLVVAASSSMSSGIQKRLIDYVVNGGKLLLVPEIPYLNENFEPCTILADFIGTKTTSFDTSDCEINVCDLVGLVNTGLWKNEALPDDAIPFAFDEISKTNLGWSKTYPNGGKIVWFGMKWRHDKLLYNEMIRRLFGLTGIKSPAVECDNPNIWTVLRSDGKRRMLFIMNLFSSPLEACIKVKEADGSYTDSGNHKLIAMEVKTVEL